MKAYEEKGSSYFRTKDKKKKKKPSYYKEKTNKI